MVARKGQKALAVDWKCCSESRRCVSHCKNVVAALVPAEERKCLTMDSQGHREVLSAAWCYLRVQVSDVKAFMKTFELFHGDTSF